MDRPNPKPIMTSYPYCAGGKPGCVVEREVMRPRPRIWRQPAKIKVQKGGTRFFSVRMLDKIAPSENDIMSARSRYPALKPLSPLTTWNFWGRTMTMVR